MQEVHSTITEYSVKDLNLNSINLPTLTTMVEYQGIHVAQTGQTVTKIDEMTSFKNTQDK